MKRLIVFFLVLIPYALSVQSKYSNRSLEFIMNNRKNASGHWNVNFSLGRLSPDMKHRNWHVKINYDDKYYNGIQSFFIEGLFSVPPSVPEDYEYFPDVGYYKFYPEKEKTFEEAKLVCAASGAHLAIINSEEEVNVLKTLYRRHPSSHSWAMLGFTDLRKKGDFRTIFGEPLSSTGYNKWHPNEPDYSHGIVHCGCMDREGLLGIVGCNVNRPFFCEFDLSWGS